MNINSTLAGDSFHIFVTSVLRQIASSKRQEIYFESNFPLDLLTNKASDRGLFDAIAPYGFDEIEGPVVFEFKAFPKSIGYDRLQSILNSLYKRIMQLTVVDATLILVTNSYLDPSIDTNKDINKSIPYKNNIEIQIWDKKIIEQWIKLYPIDFSNAQSFDTLSKAKEINAEITESDFTEKSKNNISAIRSIIERKDNFAFVLGAGVSVDPGAKSWDIVPWMHCRCSFGHSSAS